MKTFVSSFTVYVPVVSKNSRVIDHFEMEVHKWQNTLYTKSPRGHISFMANSVNELKIKVNDYVYYFTDKRKAINWSIRELDRLRKHYETKKGSSYES